MNGLRIGVLLSLLALHGAAAAADRLCFVSGDCVDFTCGRHVRAADETRPFVISSPDRGTYVFGLLGARQTKPPCQETGSIRLASVKKSGLPDVVQVTATDKNGRAWTVSLSKNQWSAPITLMLPAGDYTLEIEAAHFVRSTIAVRAPRPLLEIEFRRLPVIEGRITEAKNDEPVAGATIGSDADTYAVSDATGSFRFEADPLHWPSALRVTRGGFGEKVVPLPAARVDADLARFPSIVEARSRLR